MIIYNDETIINLNNAKTIYVKEETDGEYKPYCYTLNIDDVQIYKNTNKKATYNKLNYILDRIRDNYDFTEIK